MLNEKSYQDLTLETTQVARYNIIQKDDVRIGTLEQREDCYIATINLKTTYEEGAFRGKMILQGEIEGRDVQSALAGVKAFLESQDDNWRGGVDHALMYAKLRSKDWWRGFAEGLFDPVFKALRQRFGDEDHPHFDMMRSIGDSDAKESD